MFYRLKRLEAEKLAAQFEQGEANSSELILITTRIKEAFNQESELDNDTYDRILHKLEAKRSISTFKNSRNREGSPITPRRIVHIGILASAVAIIFLLLGIFGSPSDTLIVQKALAAVEQPGKVVYYKISGQLNDEYGSESRWQAEYWVDYDKQMLKSIHRSFGEREEFTAITLIKDGKVTNIEQSEERADMQESNAVGSFDDLITDSIKKYRQLLKSGKAQVIGEEKVAGIETYKLKAVLGATASRDGVVDVEIANVRKDNYEPVRIVYEALQIKQSQEKIIRTETIMFEDARLIDPREINESVFSIKMP